MRYEWDFGDGTYDLSSDAPVTTHAYPRFGTLHGGPASDGQQRAAKTDTACCVYVNQGNLPPVADPGGVYDVDEGSGLTLDGSGSTDPNEAAATAS